MPKAQVIPKWISNLDRPGNAYAGGPYANTDAYAQINPVPKAGAKAEAGVGRAGAAWSFFSVEAKGPNASAEAEAKGLEAGAMVRAELGSVSAAVGPAEVTVGLAVDSGVTVSTDKVELKLLGTGVTWEGPKIGISLFGSEFKLRFW